MIETRVIQQGDVCVKVESAKSMLATQTTASHKFELLKQSLEEEIFNARDLEDP